MKVTFFGHEFSVSPDVLTPRPETEWLVEKALRLDLPTNAKIADIGTGSGVIGLSLALARPKWQTTLADISSKALRIARQNTRSLKAKNIQFVQSDLMETLSGKFDLIVANLPYVDRSWSWVKPGELKDPPSALYAEDGGLELIRQLVVQANDKLADSGYLILECDESQTTAVIDFAIKRGFFHAEILTGGYGICLQKEK
jgi:release factor glutamine methyltransferase